MTVTIIDFERIRNGNRLNIFFNKINSVVLT